MVCTALVASVMMDGLLPSHLSPRSLARLASACRATYEAAANDDSVWIAAANHAGLSGARSRDAVAKHYRENFTFCSDIVAHANVEQGGRRIILDLGAAGPRRIAAAHSLLSIGRYREIDFVVRSLSHASNHHVVLWLGVMYCKDEDRALDTSSHDEALAGYDVAPQTSMSERFGRGHWSMNAIGSSGAVWSDGSVVRMIVRRFAAGDTVTLIVDGAKRQLRVRVTSAHGVATEHVAVNRLVRSTERQATPRMHAIAHLTDVAVPAIGRPARAVIDVVGATIQPR